MSEASGVGIGVDAHALVEGVPLVLGGVEFPDEPAGLAGHSDGDVIAHALIDAVLGAAGLGDIGSLFPSGDPQWKGSSSLDLLRHRLRRGAGGRATSSSTPTASSSASGRGSRRVATRCAHRLAAAMGVDPSRVAVRATTTDGLGFTGRGEGLAAQAVALVERVK